MLVACLMLLAIDYAAGLLVLNTVLRVERLSCSNDSRKPYQIISLYLAWFNAEQRNKLFPSKS